MESLRRLIEYIAILRQLLQLSWYQIAKGTPFPLNVIRSAERESLTFGQPKFSTKRPSFVAHLEHTGEVTPALSSDFNKTREVAVTSEKLKPIGVGDKRLGLLPTVGEIIASHWTATARLKLSAPGQLGAVSPQ